MPCALGNGELSEYEDTNNKSNDAVEISVKLEKQTEEIFDDFVSNDLVAAFINDDAIDIILDDGLITFAIFVYDQLSSFFLFLLSRREQVPVLQQLLLHLSQIADIMQ